MATAMGGDYVTLVDVAKRTKPGGGIDAVVEVLAASNPVIGDANVMEGNLPTGHRSTQRASQPSGTWRKLNLGVAAEKSTTQQVDDTCGMLEGYSKIDVDLASLGGNAVAFRASEDQAFVAGFNSTIATAIFYGNQGLNPEQIQGFAPRYNLTTGSYGDYIINASGSGSDNTSIWLITWGPQTCSLIYPKGSKMGLTTEDLGKQLVTDSNNLMYQAYVTKFQWKLGLTIKDYRYATRVANIDVSDLTDDASSGADIIRKMIAAYWTRPTEAIDGGKLTKTFFYCNKTVGEYLHVQASNKSNVNLSLDMAGGKPIVSMLGVPIHICDNITSAEAAIS